MYKPLQIQAPQTSNTKNPPLNRPPNISPPRACAWKIALKYKVKEGKNGKFLPTIRLAQSILKRKFPSILISPSKRAFEKYKPRGLFLEFYGIYTVGDLIIQPLIFIIIINIVPSLFCCRLLEGFPGENLRHYWFLN